MVHRTRKIVSYCNHDPVYVELPNWTFQKLNQEPVRGSAGQSHGMVHIQCHRLTSCKDFAGRRILEFGAGQSTLWWARRAEFVLAFEDNKDWFQQLKPQLAANIKLELVNGQMPDIEPGFDIIVVDGLHRPTCSELSTKL